jgi:two-component system response regulator VicR
MSTKSNKSKSILIVEDESSLNEAYQIILANAGYDILSAFDGKEALDIVEQYNPDLILLDLRMPVMDGIEFLKNYNPSKKNRAKVVVFSNYDLQKEIEEAYDLGADKYVLKAWASPKELLKMVKDIIK